MSQSKAALNNASVSDLLDQALSRLRAQDIHLLKVDASERAVTHRLACHLDSLFPGWDVDCEYNRERIAQKLDPKSNHSRFPDIIVHRRGTDDNLLMIEVKKASASKSRKCRDKVNLARIKKSLAYKHAAFIVLKTGEAALAIGR